MSTIPHTHNWRHLPRVLMALSVLFCAVGGLGLYAMGSAVMQAE